IPGLEKELEGKEAGAELTVVVQPAEGYGEYQEQLVQDVPLDAFAGVDKIEPGMSFRAESNAGPMMVTVKAVGDDVVTVDGNHMLAGEVLNFDVAIKSVRAATEAEISQGMAEIA
ncbi:MAG: peptidylprolyl isomerase, partial [Pseudomonadota bacterium]